MANEKEAPLVDELGQALVAVDEKLADLERELRPLADRKKILIRQKLQRLDEILRERSALAEQLVALDQLYPDGPTTPAYEKPAIVEPGQEGQHGQYAKMMLWEASRDVLRRERRMLPTGEIARQVMAGGRRISDPPASKISSILSQRDDLFVSELREGRKRFWGLKEWASERVEAADARPGS